MPEICVTFQSASPGRMVTGAGPKSVFPPELADFIQ
jgi:hypothetical protein